MLQRTKKELVRWATIIGTIVTVLTFVWYIYVYIGDIRVDVGALKATVLSNNERILKLEADCILMTKDVANIKIETAKKNNKVKTLVKKRKR